MSTYVVAGVTGRIGSVVARELLSRDENVRLIVRSAARGRPWIRRGTELAVGSLEDRASLTGAAFTGLLVARAAERSLESRA